MDLPFVRQGQDRGTTRTYTLTVDDGHGGVSSDSVTIRVPTEEESFDFYLWAPAPAESIVAGMPSTLTWYVHDPAAILESLSLSYSIDDGRTFHVVPGCESLAPRARQCVWQNPGPVGDLVRLRLTAVGLHTDFMVSDRISIGSMPAGWESRDIGAVGATGSTGFAGGAWSVEGSGADIWGTADEFRYLSRQVTGDFTAVVRVASIENLSRWVKAGLMIRENLAAGSRHVSLFATPRTERGIAFQRRRVADGISVHTAGPAAAPPGWLALGRVGDTISAYYRPSAAASWTLVGRDTMPDLPASDLRGTRGVEPRRRFARDGGVRQSRRRPGEIERLDRCRQCRYPWKRNTRRRRLRGESLGCRHLGNRRRLPRGVRASGPAIREMTARVRSVKSRARVVEGWRHVPGVPGTRRINARHGSGHARKGCGDAVSSRRQRTEHPGRSARWRRARVGAPDPPRGHVQGLHVGRWRQLAPAWYGHCRLARSFQFSARAWRSRATTTRR